MTRAAGHARSDDSGSLREDGLNYVACDRPRKLLEPVIPSRSTKSSTRGFNHPVIGRLLCPIKYICMYDEDSASYVVYQIIAVRRLRAFLCLQISSKA